MRGLPKNGSHAAVAAGRARQRQGYDSGPESSTESSTVAPVAGIAGTLASLGLAATSFVMLDLRTRAEVVLSFEPTPKVLVLALLGALVMGLGGGLLPAWRAARVSALAALRS